MHINYIDPGIDSLYLHQLNVMLRWVKVPLIWKQIHVKTPSTPDPRPPTTLTLDPRPPTPTPDACAVVAGSDCWGSPPSGAVVAAHTGQGVPAAW